jgi:phosphoribosyl 1,2-cyclic phosphate phosphodiesterase
MEVIFLGTGTSQGIPMIACSCAVCSSDDPRNCRSRTSVHVVMDGLRIQVDAAPELRLQCVRERISGVDLFILTHGHADHVLGMDDLRRYCDLRGGEGLPVSSTPDALERVRAIYPYAIGDRPEFRGYPAFKLRDMPPRLELEQGTIESVCLPHGRVQVLGLVFTERSSGRKFAYYTDCKLVGPQARDLAAGADLLALDGLRQEPHPTHMTIDEATATALEIGVPVTYLTHLTHTVDHAAVEATLPPQVRLAYDGLRISL